MENLQEKLKEEEHQKKFLADKAAQLQTEVCFCANLNIKYSIIIYR